MRRKSQPHTRNIHRSQFRDNTVINQGDTHIHPPAHSGRALTHIIPYPRNEDFINRSDIVGKLDRLLPQSSEFYSAALCGLGGSGGTRVALDYTYRRCGTHSVFWVHADTKAAIMNDYKMIARKFGDIDEKLDDEGLLMAVCHRIEAESEWLFVLDNADDLSLFGIGITSSSAKTLLNYIPRGPKGLVLWTTRDKRIKGTLVSPIRAVEVGDMSLDEATILLSMATETTRDKATYEDINNMHRLGQEAARYSLRMKKPLAKGSTTIRTNNILQDNKGALEVKDESFFAMRALNVISYMAEDLHESGEAQVLGDDYMTHALQVVEWMELCGEGSAISDKLSAVSDLLGDLNEWKGRELLDEKILAMRQKILGVEHPDTLNSMAALTMSYFGQAFADRDDGTLRFDVSYPWKNSQYYTRKAYELGMEVLGLRHKVLGPAQSDTIASWKIITEIQCAQGQYNAATKIAQNVLDTQQTLYGERHPKTLAAMEDLAYVFYIQGQYTQALNIREEVVRLQKETAGEKSLATMLAMYNLAISWNQCGRRGDALTLMKECYKLQESAFGLFHRIGLGCNWHIEEWEDELSDGDAHRRDSASLLMGLHIDSSMNNN